MFIIALGIWAPVYTRLTLRKKKYIIELLETIVLTTGDTIILVLIKMGNNENSLKQLLSV